VHSADTCRQDLANSTARDRCTALETSCFWDVNATSCYITSLNCSLRCEDECLAAERVSLCAWNATTLNCTEPAANSTTTTLSPVVLAVDTGGPTATDVLKVIGGTIGGVIGAVTLVVSLAPALASAGGVAGGTAGGSAGGASAGSASAGGGVSGMGDRRAPSNPYEDDDFEL